MEYALPAQDEILSKKTLFDKYQETTPWHSMGDRVVQQLTKSAKPYVHRFEGFPESFFNSVMDQYLAVLWHTGGNREAVPCGQPWLYHSFIVTKLLSNDLYRCCDETGTEFTLFSHSVTIGLEEENRRLFLTVLLDMNGWYMTYGPVLGWKGFGCDDFKYLAKYVAAQMYRNNGLSSVIQSNPLPFWAAYNIAEIPPIFHKDKFSEWCSLSGIFKDGTLPVLPGTWKREEKGIWLRLVYSKEDIFRRRCIYYNTKTDAALLTAGDTDSFNKTVTAAGHGFDAQADEPEIASMAMVSFVQDLLKKTPESFRLEKLFGN